MYFKNRSHRQMLENTEDYAEKIAEYLVGFKAEKLSDRTIDSAKMAVLDTLGCLISASQEKANKKIWAFLTESNTAKRPVMPIYLSTLPKEWECFYWSHLSAFLDYDTGHRLSGVHSSGVAVSCSFLACLSGGLSGNDLIHQVVAGTELSSRLGMATQPFQFRRGLDPSGTCNIFTSVAVFSLAFGLRHKEISEALRIASTLTPLSPTQWTQSGSMSKSLAIAMSAKLGYIAVQLAKKGLTGPRFGIEGPEGFLNGVVAPDSFESDLIFNPPLGQVEINRLYFKFYCSCAWTHSVIDAALEASKGECLAEESIENVEVIVSEQIARQDNPNPKDETAAKFSIPYCTALALLKGSVKMEYFAMDQIEDSHIFRLCQRIRVIGNPEYDKLFPNVRPAEVSIFLSNGKTLTAKVDHPRGDPEKPASKDDIQSKFFELTRGILSESSKNKLISFIDSLDQLPDLIPIVEAIEV